jgi:molybdopterin adenylyltransferase
MNIRFGIITISDRSARGERPDQSGPAIIEKINQQGWQVATSCIIPDETDDIQEKITSWSDRNEVDVILTSGGTGFSPRDVTPEATQAVIERPAPGLAEAMRSASLEITPHAMLSRATAGIRKQTLIINLPGSPKAAVENLEVVLPVLPHAVELLQENPEAEAGHRPAAKTANK